MIDLYAVLWGKAVEYDKMKPLQDMKERQDIEESLLIEQSNESESEGWLDSTYLTLSSQFPGHRNFAQPVIQFNFIIVKPYPYRVFSYAILSLFILKV